MSYPVFLSLSGHWAEWTEQDRKRSSPNIVIPLTNLDFIPKSRELCNLHSSLCGTAHVPARPRPVTRIELNALESQTKPLMNCSGRKQRRGIPVQFLPAAKPAGQWITIGFLFCKSARGPGFDPRPRQTKFLSLSFGY